MAEELWPHDPLTALANRYLSDKGTQFNCAHGYTRIYHTLLAPVRDAPLRLLEIGLLHGQLQAENADKIPELGCPSLRMWADYLPRTNIYGFDIVDFTAFATDRIKIAQGDQGNRDNLEAFARAHGPFDVIIDDGSHASHHQQITLGVLFQHLSPGGLYIVEDLHFQPAQLEIAGITLTREFLRTLRHGQTGNRLAISQAELGQLLGGLRSINFFDSLSPRWPLRQTEDALAVLVKQGVHPHLRVNW